MLAFPRRRIGRLAYGFQLVALASMLLSVPRVSAQVGAATATHVPGDERAWAQSSPDDLMIKLVTFGPGDQIFNYFGHNGMIVEDRAQRVARLYNFGMFHFGLSMLPNYMKGKLTFWVAATPVRATFAHYHEANRSIRIQELNLLPQKRKAIADALDFASAPENRDYLYDHFFNNCSTRLRDLVDDATDGQFKQHLDHPARMSYRQHIRRYAERDPVTDFALVFWMNDFMERAIKQWDELFLPEELEQQVARMHYRNGAGQSVPLVAASYEVFTADRPPTPEFPNRGYPWALALGALLGALAWLNGIWAARAHSTWPRRLLGLQHTLFGIVLGIPGLAAALMWAFTEHTVTYRNENLLLSNPLTFALFPLGLGIVFGSERALRYARVACYALAASSLALLLLKLLPSFNQDTNLPMALFLPANLGYALAHRAIVQRAISPVLSVESRSRAVSRA
jgi:hypothetical protein